MNKLQKVFRGLECCKSRSTCNDECPYYHIMENPNFGMDDCTSMLASDALSLLKAQKPRVMTLEEAKNADHCFCEAGSLFVCRIVPVPDGWVTIQQFGRPDMEIDSNEYGIAFRCWTSTPSKEQMEATPWL